MKKNGFTLLEIIVTLIIIGVISGFAVSRYFHTIELMKLNEGKKILISLLGAQKRYYLEENTYTTEISQLDIDLKPSPYFSALTNSDCWPDYSLLTGDLIRLREINDKYYLFIDAQGKITCWSNPVTVCQRFGIPANS